MTPSPQLENYFASGGLSGFQQNAQANANLEATQAETAQRQALTQQAGLQNQLTQEQLNTERALGRAYQEAGDTATPMDIYRASLKYGANPSLASEHLKNMIGVQTSMLTMKSDQLKIEDALNDRVGSALSGYTQAPAEAQTPQAWAQARAAAVQAEPKLDAVLPPADVAPSAEQVTPLLARVNYLGTLTKRQLEQAQAAEAAAKANESASTASLNAAKTPGATAESTLKQKELQGMENLTPESAEAMVEASIPKEKYPEEHARAVAAVQNAVKLGLGTNAVQGAIKDSADRIGRLESAVAQAKATQPIKIETALATQNAAADQAQNSGAMDMMAEQALNGQFSSRNPMLLSRVYARAAELAKERGLTNQQALMERFGAQANRQALDSVTKQYETLKPFAEMAEKNANILETKAQKVSNLGGSFFNTPLRDLQSKFAGNTDVAAYRAALLPVQADFARILNSPTGSGELTDEARREMEAAISPGATPQQITAALDVFRTDAKNRKGAYEAQLADLKGRTVVGAPASTPNSSTPAATSGTIRVRRKSDGKTGTLKPGDFDPSKYEKL